MPSVPLKDVIARSVSDLRESRGWTQEELVLRVRDVGLPWSRAQVTDVERGRRQDLSLAEAAMLAEALGVRLADLVPEEAPSIKLGIRERPARMLHRLLAGEPPVDADLRGPTIIPDLPGGPHWVRTVEGEAPQIFSWNEVQAARLLGYRVARIRTAARATWDHDVDAERDRRESQLPAPEHPHAWEAMLDDLRRTLEHDDAAET